MEHACVSTKFNWLIVVLQRKTHPAITLFSLLCLPHAFNSRVRHATSAILHLGNYRTYKRCYQLHCTQTKSLRHRKQNQTNTCHWNEKSLEWERSLEQESIRRERKHPPGTHPPRNALPHKLPQKLPQKLPLKLPRKLPQTLQQHRTHLTQAIQNIKSNKIFQTTDPPQEINNNNIE